MATTTSAALETRLGALAVDDGEDGDSNSSSKVSDDAGIPAQAPPSRLLVPGSTVSRHQPDKDNDGDAPAPAPAPASQQPPQQPPQQHAWGPADPSGFEVRAAHYKRLGRKAPSLGDFYQLVAFDFVRTPRGPVDHIARGMDLGPLVPAATHPSLPPLFVVNCQLPDSEPAVFGGGGGGDDGPSRSAVFVFAIRPETVAALGAPRGTADTNNNTTNSNNNSSPALRLLVDYCRRAPTDPEVRGRFKVIACCRNLEALALPAFIANYNGKPVLITKSGALFRGPQHLEMDVRVARFSFLARKGLAALRARFVAMVLDVAFLVEGRAEEELPEGVLGGARLHRLDYERAAPFDLDVDIDVDGVAVGLRGSGNGNGNGGRSGDGAPSK